MTRNRFIRRFNKGRFTPEKSRRMNKARWDAERARRGVEEPERLRELAEIEAQNLPRKTGDALGCLQWTDYRTGQVRKWIFRIGERRDQITMEFPGGSKTKSHGFSWAMTQLRKHLTN